MTPRQRRRLWVAGVLSEVACIVTMMLTGKSDFLWAFFVWGALSAFLVLWTSRDPR